MNIPLQPGELAVISLLVKDLTGIIIDDSKKYLVESRLGPLVRKLGYSSYAELYRNVKDNNQNQIREAFIDAISVNETSFFRDYKPFELIKHKLVPDLLDQDKRRPVTIWSAACSTGQECYSIAIVLKEILFKFTEFNIKIVGTDISERAIAKASRGEYNNFEIKRGLQPSQVGKYFSSTDGDHYRILDELRSIIQFRQANLLLPHTIPGSFDIILCRNVAIYFKPSEKEKLYKILISKLKTRGSLIIGSTETMIGVNHLFHRHEFHGAIYYTVNYLNC